jgi:hypothetical protein
LLDRKIQEDFNMPRFVLCLAAIGGIAGIAAFTACNGDGPTAPSSQTHGVASIEVSPASVSSPEGETVTFRALVRNAQGEEIPATDIHWRTSDPLIAQIDANGIATARTKHGATEVIAELEGKQGVGALTSQARCANPAPVDGSGTADLPSMIVQFRSSVKRPQALSLELSQKYRFQVVHFYEAVFPGFSARLPYATIAQLRCEASVSNLQFDQLLFPD